MPLSEPTRVAPGESPLPAEAGTPDPTRRRHLYELDLVRVLTFACVIAVHTISHTVWNDIPSYALLTLLHFTRETFFALSGFVLIYTSMNRSGRALFTFTRRRFLLVLIPYFVWSTIYFFLGDTAELHGSVGAVLGAFVVDLLTGTAWYHLYFLLVSLQVYLLLPLIIALVKKTRQHHVAVLVVSGIVQLVLTAFYMYKPAGFGWVDAVSTEFVLSYQFFILLGAIAADHAEQLLSWVRNHRKLISAGAVVTALVTIGYFLVAVSLGLNTTDAATALQPIVMVWSFAISLGLLALGTLWADRRKPGLLNRVIGVASDRSFGIFLSHPLIILALMSLGDGWFAKNLHAPWPLTVVIYLLVIVGSVALTELARRSPLSLALTGRPFRPLVPWKKP